MNFFEVSMLAGTFILIAFAGHLFTYTKGNALLNKLIGIIFLTRGVQNLSSVFISLGHPLGFELVITLVPLLTFLAPAATYLYIRAFIRDESKISPINLLHLLPALFFLINMLPVLLAAKTIKWEMIDQILLNNDLAGHPATLFITMGHQFMIRSIIYLIYLGFAWQIFIKAEKGEKRQSEPTNRLYLILFLSFFTVINLFIFSINISRQLNGSTLSLMTSNQVIMTISSIMMYLFILFFIRHPRVLYGNISFEPAGSLKEKPESAADQPSPIVMEDLAEARPLLTPDQIKNYLDRLHTQMLDEKPFLITGITMIQLAEQFKIPVHHYSYLVNQLLKKNFREYINQYRINYFISKYTEESEAYTLEFLCGEAGFRNRNTFILAFKNETGLTPSKYFKRGFDPKNDLP